MKKILIFLVILFVLTSCGTSNSDIEAAKQAMLDGRTTVEVEADTEADRTIASENDTEPSESVEVNKTTFSEIIPVDDVQFLDFNAISETDLQAGEVEISGTTLVDVDKITVSFTNKTSDYPDDFYTLKTFKSGADSFKYLASSRFKVLDFGVNTYLITAHSGRETSETRVVLALWEGDESVEDESKLVGVEENVELVDLPTSQSFGKPLMLGEDAFTYSEIDGLEVKKISIPELSCENVTDFLSNNINTWFYWNTCRDLLKDKIVTFYVVKLNGEEYVYEKHYVDYVNSFYGVYDVQTGTWITKDNIADKNKELKALNDDFENTTQVDRLFKEIVN